MENTEFALGFEGADETVFALACCAQDDTCFAACSSGLYRSRDGGRNWQSLRASDERLTTTAVALSPDYAHDRSIFAAVKGGILRSSDGGDTWFTTGFPAPPPLFTTIRVSPNFEEDGMLLAGTMEDGIFSSTDRGVHWQPWNFGLFDLGVLCLALSPNWSTDETVLAGTESGLYRSTNGGRAWRFSAFPADSAPVQSVAWLQDDVSNQSLILAGTESQGLLASHDHGAVWQRIAEHTIPHAVDQLVALHNQDGGYTLFALVDDGILRSDDFARSWTGVVHTEALTTAMLPLNAAQNVLLLGVLGKGIMRLAL